jgi:lysozyme
LTIGYGHVIQPGETLMRISQDEALNLLQADAVREAAPVARALTVPLTVYQSDAVISLAFNCGGRAIARSTLLKKLNAGLMTDAAEEFIRWNKIGRAESRGLTRRRRAEQALFLNGDYGN